MHLLPGKKDFLILAQPEGSLVCPRCEKSVSEMAYYARGFRRDCPMCGETATVAVNMPLKAIVRKATLRAFGNYSMGIVAIRGGRYVVSGDYGQNGQPMRLPLDVYNRFCTALPKELEEAWGADTTSHNSAGVSGRAIRRWALKEFFGTRAKARATR